MIKRILVLVLIANAAFGQKKIKSLEVSDTIVHAYIDRPGDLYVITRSNHFQKFDQDGKLQILFKAPLAPTLFDPRDGARHFAYYRPSQQYEFLSPSFETTAGYRIDSTFVIQPWLVCPSGDYKLWVLDAVDHSLKKLNPRESAIEIEVLIDSTVIRDATSFSTMKEYQGFVFLLDAAGIEVFSAMGKHLMRIPAPGIRAFNFLGEELYYQTGRKVVFFDLFTAETREIDSPAPGQLLFSDQRLFAIDHKRIDIFEFTP